MKKLISLTITIGFATLLIGIILKQLAPVQAALPPDHPPIPQPGDAAAVTGKVATTLNDFFLPGTQPNMLTDNITDPQVCAGCHTGYSFSLNQPQNYEPWFGWQGSMMAQSGRDPLFYAALDIANADADFAGEYCLRCHLPRGWLDGRSTTTDASAMTPEDLEGVQCAVCHRMVDPVASNQNPARDTLILNSLAPTFTVTTTGSASIIVDPLDHRRGPFNIVADLDNLDPHVESSATAKATLQSPYHQEAAFCGSCHDINNPLFTWDATEQAYLPNPLDTPADPATMFPVERTYSEWALSDYNTPQGVYAPQFGGNKTHVATCQDCHMRDVTGVGGNFYGNLAPERTDLPMHDLTGANTWVPQIIPQHPVFSSTFTTGIYAATRRAALEDGIDRARYMLRNAATLSTTFNIDTQQLTVTVTNESGHKLPTGYIEGRRMWLQVEGYDINGNLVYQSGAYDPTTAVLTPDPDLKLYQAQHGLTPDWAAQVGMSPGHTFHFVLNNAILEDNRIPPRGYTYAAFNAAGAAPYTNSQPDPTRYADGQYWDTTLYQLPATAAFGRVRLLHQIASKEYVEFLRDNAPNPADPNGRGNILYDLWQANPSPPETMAAQTFSIFPETLYLPAVVRP